MRTSAAEVIAEPVAPVESEPVEVVAPAAEIVPHTAEPALLNTPPTAEITDTPAETAPAEPTEPAAELATETAPAAEGDKPPVEPVAEPTEPAPAVTEPPAPPEPVKYEPLALELPEGATLDNERVAEFDSIIAPVGVPPEARQKLAEMHVAEMQRYATHVAQEQQRIFAETRRSWREEVQADPELWRPGIDLADQPAVAAAKRMIDQFVPTSQRAAFDQALLTTGMGDHPAMIRFLANIAKKMDAPIAPLAPTNPPPDRGGARGAGRRLRDLYDHPRSRTG